MFGSERVRQVWVEVENASAIFHDEAAMAQPPESGRITDGMFDFVEQGASA